MRERINKLKYTLAHKKAFLYIEKQLYGKNSFRGYLHDVDKIIMYPILGNKLTSKIHRKISKHHGRAKTKKDYKQMIVDWECARITKPDKPLNAYETLYKYYPELESNILPLLGEVELV